MVVVMAAGTAGVALVPMVMVMFVLMVMLVMVLMLLVAVMMLVLVVMVVVMMVVLVLVLIAVGAADLLHELLGQGVAALHGGDDLGPGELVPGGGEDSRLGVVGTQHGYVGGQLGLVHVLGPAEEDSGGVLHLVVEELAKVLHIDLALHRVHHGDKAVQLHIQVLGHAFHGAGHVAQLAHAGGLDDDAVGVVLLHHLLQGGAEITHQRAADAAGVQLIDLDAGLLQEAAVDADLTELVLDQNDLLAGKGLLDEFFDQSGLAGAQEAGKNINFGHSLNASFFVSRQSRRALARKILHLYYSKPVNGKTAFFKKKL